MRIRPARKRTPPGVRHRFLSSGDCKFIVPVHPQPVRRGVQGFARAPSSTSNASSRTPAQRCLTPRDLDSDPVARRSHTTWLAYVSSQDEPSSSRHAVRVSRHLGLVVHVHQDRGAGHCTIHGTARPPRASGACAPRGRSRPDAASRDRECAPDVRRAARRGRGYEHRPSGLPPLLGGDATRLGDRGRAPGGGSPRIRGVRVSSSSRRSASPASVSSGSSSGSLASGSSSARCRVARSSPVSPSSRAPSATPGPGCIRASGSRPCRR